MRVDSNGVIIEFKPNSRRGIRVFKAIFILLAYLSIIMSVFLGGIALFEKDIETGLNSVLGVVFFLYSRDQLLGKYGVESFIFFKNDFKYLVKVAGFKYSKKINYGDISRIEVLSKIDKGFTAESQDFKFVIEYKQIKLFVGKWLSKSEAEVYCMQITDVLARQRTVM